MKRVIFTTMLTLAMAIPYAAATANNFFAKTDASASANAAAVVDAKSLTRAQVRMIQRALVASGYEVETDGLWRAGTRSAVQVYQKSRGINANGALTPETLAGLGVDLNADARTEAAVHGAADTASNFADTPLPRTDAEADARFSGQTPAKHRSITFHGSISTDAGGSDGISGAASSGTGAGIAGASIGSTASAGGSLGGALGRKH